MDTTTEDTDRQTPVCPQRVHKGRIGLIVAASLAMGLLAAIVWWPPHSFRRQSMS